MDIIIQGDRFSISLNEEAIRKLLPAAYAKYKIIMAGGESPSNALEPVFKKFEEMIRKECGVRNIPLPKGELQFQLTINIKNDAIEKLEYRGRLRPSEGRRYVS